MVKKISKMIPQNKKKNDYYLKIIITLSLV